MSYETEQSQMGQNGLKWDRTVQDKTEDYWTSYGLFLVKKGSKGIKRGRRESKGLNLAC